MDQTSNILNLLLWAVGLGFTFNFGLMLTMWAHFNKRFDSIEDRLTKLEYDMIEVKTVLRLKECCMIKDERQMKKVE